ncbi:MAG: ferritin-like domain-containing protein [Pseudonocardiaceae bacterium]
MEQRFFTAGSITALSAEARLDGVPGVTEPLHDPPLEPRDEVVFLLTAAAEIEHALMVQYLYAAYSVHVHDDGPNRNQLAAVQNLLTQIAREEMGHLATVQNLLHLVGGPLNLNREHSPYASEIYPFRFTLEPLTLDSLAKYVIAESPAVPPSTFSDADRALLENIRRDATRSNDGHEVRHVGLLYQRLAHLFGDVLADNDFRLDIMGRQAGFEDWGFQPGNPADGEALIIESFPGTDVGQVRAAAVTAVRKIDAQGEGFDLPPAGPDNSESHFERFFDIYQRVQALSAAGAVITWPVTENPNTTAPTPETPAMADMVAAVQEAHAHKGRITHPRARAWAHLFNLRYRMLLGRFSHVMRLDQALYSHGDRTARGLLLIWTFDEMRRLKKIASKLVALPKDDPPGQLHAGPPFELPYTVNLPEGEPQRWRTHLDSSRAAVRLIREQLQPDDQLTDRDPFLDDLLRQDTEAQIMMEALVEGREIPPASVPRDFQKAVRILEEAVRGFSIGRPHRNFWTGKTRDQFLDTSVLPNVPPVLRNPDGTVNRDPNTSPLVQRLEGTAPGNRMPRFRPPVPGERIGFIRQWITDGCPDADPPGQVGVAHERDPAPEPLTPLAPAPQAPLSFDADIRNLFRETPDRTSMLAIAQFDLHRYEDVRDRADTIAARLDDGSMPCDGSWPRDRIAKFHQWIEDGKRP